MLSTMEDLAYLSLSWWLLQIITIIKKTYLVQIAESSAETLNDKEFQAKNFSIYLFFSGANLIQARFFYILFFFVSVEIFSPTRSVSV